MAPALTFSQIKKYGYRLLGQKLRIGLPRHWQQKRAIRKLVKDGSAPAVQALAMAVLSGNQEDDDLQQILMDALSAMHAFHQLEVIAEIATEHKANQRSKQLFTLIKQADYLPEGHPDRRVAVALACGWPERLSDDGPEIVPELLTAWRETSTGSCAEEALKGLRESHSKNALCSQWFTDAGKDSSLLHLIRYSNHLPEGPPGLRVAVALACGWPERLSDDGPEIVPELLKAWKDSSTRELAELALTALRTTAARDSLCEQWFNSQEEMPGLFELVKKMDHLPLQDPKLRVAVALACEWPERLAHDGHEVMMALCEAWDNTSCRVSAVAAIGALRSKAAIDTLCRHWMDSGAAGDELAETLLRAGHAPSDPAERALFWLLIGQLQRYEELDLDGRLLTQAQASASVQVRKHLAAAVAAAGRTEWLGAMQKTKDLSDFTEDDWATTVAVLMQSGDPVALWQWALQAPPIHARTLVGSLQADAKLPAHIGDVASSIQRLAVQLPSVPDRHHLFPDHATTIRGTSLANSIAWSPDGLCLASGSDDGTIRLWDPIKGVCTHILEGHGNMVRSIAWSPDGRCLASGGDDMTIRLWDPTSGVCTHILEGHTDWVRSISWSPDGRCFASGSDDETIRLWDPTSGVCTKELERHTRYRHVNAIVWSPDGRHLASSGKDNTIRLWDPDNGACTHMLSGHTKFVQSIAWAPDGNGLASCSNDNTIRLWNTASSACTHTLSGHTDWVRSISWSPDGLCLASCSNDNTIRLWNAASNICTHTLSGHTEWVRSISWSPDGLCLASIGSDTTIRLWDPVSGKCTSNLEGHTQLVDLIAWSPDGRCLAASSDDRTIRLWDPTTGACAYTLAEGHTDSVNSISWSPDGKELASGSNDGTIRLWEPVTKTCTHILKGHSNIVRSTAWSPDGRCLASGGDDMTIRLWDPTSGAGTHILEGHTDWVYSIAWSPDARCLASSGRDKTLRLWDPATKACTHTWEGQPDWVFSIAWSPDGQCLASGSHDGTIRLWNPVTKVCTHTWEGHADWVYSIAWSPDGRCLATCSRDKTLRLWDPATSTKVCTHTWEGKTDWVLSIAWSPDGRCLTSGSNDGTIRFWDLAIGECTHTLSDHTEGVSSIVWSPNGRYLASCYGQTIQIWTNEFLSLLAMPLACYGMDQWRFLSALQERKMELEGWQRPWLDFIADLGTQVRRFDVSVDDDTTHPTNSPFEVEIDG